MKIHVEHKNDIYYNINVTTQYIIVTRITWVLKTQMWHLPLVQVAIRIIERKGGEQL